MMRPMVLILALAPAALAQKSPGPAAPAPPPAPFLAAPAAAPSATPAAAPGPSAGPAQPVENRQISAGAAALLAQVAPAYNPPKPQPPPKPDAADDDDDDSEQPRNHIIRLPKFIVHEQAPPIFREKDLYDKEGLTRLAMLRYGGLNVGPMSGLNSPVADELYREDDRLKSIQGFDDTADAMARGGDPAEASFIRSTTQSTYAQSLGWGDPTPQNPSARGLPGSP